MNNLYGLLDDAQLKEHLSVINPLVFNLDNASDRLYKLMQSCHHSTSGTGIESFIFWSSNSPELVGIEQKLRDAWNEIAQDSIDVSYLAKECELANSHTLTNYVNQHSSDIISEKLASAIDGITTQADAEIAIEMLAKIVGLSPIQLDATLTTIAKKSGINKPALHETYLLNQGSSLKDSTWPQPAINGRLPMTYDNVRYFLELNRIDVRFNLMTGRLHILIPGRKVTNLLPDERYDYEVMRGLMIAAGLPMSKQTIVDVYIMRYANQPGRIYHPVQAWLASGKCDYRDHFGWLMQSLTSRGTTPGLQRTYLIKWLLQCIEAVYEPSGIRSSIMLILQGEQGIGKSRWLANLVPDNYAHEWMATASINRYWKLIKQLGASKDTIFESWICEIADIDKMLLIGQSESKLQRSKASSHRFLDRQVDHRDEHINFRRTSFAGTYSSPVNFASWVANRRYLILQVTDINFDIKIDPLQLWLQVKEWYDQGLRHYMSIEDIREHLASVKRNRPKIT